MSEACAAVAHLEATESRLSHADKMQAVTVRVSY